MGSPARSNMPTARLIGLITSSPAGTPSAPPGRKSRWTSTTINASPGPMCDAFTAPSAPSRDAMLYDSGRMTRHFDSDSLLLLHDAVARLDEGFASLPEF